MLPSSGQLVLPQSSKLGLVPQACQSCDHVIYLFPPPADQFQCAHGKKCIERDQVCDGVPQCQDRSDELECFKTMEGCYHRCDDKSRCIPETFLCDGEGDCQDGTDEANCGMRPNKRIAFMLTIILAVFKQNLITWGLPKYSSLREAVKGHASCNENNMVVPF